MMKKNLIEKLIFESLEQLVNETGIKLKISTPEDTPIFGSESKLDSLGLVTFLVELEQKIEDHFDVEITIADEKAMSQKNSPFKNVYTLSEYIKSLLQPSSDD